MPGHFGAGSPHNFQMEAGPSKGFGGPELKPFQNVFWGVSAHSVGRK
jgi:hypothetical protein